MVNLEFRIREVDESSELDHENDMKGKTYNAIDLAIGLSLVHQRENGRVPVAVRVMCRHVLMAMFMYCGDESARVAWK